MVAFGSHLKEKFNFAGSIRRGQVGAEEAFVPAGNTRLAVQGKADCIKDGGFSRPGLAMNKKEGVFTEAGEINGFLDCKGSEGTHGDG